ncbi:MAG: histidine--tRNA ligase [Bacteriovoracaceae bacterium]|nr:histidine--tRNA ligase [Bacteriovoracaceae bacterium]
MALSKNPYRGTRDFFPAQKRERDYLFAQMKKTAELFGYEPYDGPLLEEVELYKAKSGEELINDQIYDFKDRGGRHVAIRPEMTPTLARMVAHIYRTAPLPIRLYAIPNLMRYEKPQRGRLREHWQFNCDIFGASEIAAALEILQVAVHLLESLGAKENDFAILFNHRLAIDVIFQKYMQLGADQAYRLYKTVDKIKKLKPGAFEEMVAELGLSTQAGQIFQEYLALKDLGQTIAYFKKYQSLAPAESTKFLTFAEQFAAQIEAAGIAKYLRYDPTVVRGLDYYTGIVFEIFDLNPENPRAISGGGAYANLLQIFGEGPLVGVGLGLGDVTLADFLRSHKLMPDFSLPQQDIFLTLQDERCLPLLQRLAVTWRKFGFKVTTHFEPLKFNKVFPLAEKRGATWVALLGEKELQENVVQIKNMATREQINLKIDDEAALKNLGGKA